MAITTRPLAPAPSSRISVNPGTDQVFTFQAAFRRQSSVVGCLSPADRKRRREPDPVSPRGRGGVLSNRCSTAAPSRTSRHRCTAWDGARRRTRLRTGICRSPRASPWPSAASTPGRSSTVAKRHIAVDTDGFPMMIMVTPADAPGRDAAREILHRLRHTHPQLTQVWADSAYAGQFVNESGDFHDLTLQAASRPHGTKGFVVLPRRGKVERTIGWLMKARRNIRDYRSTPRPI
ncbi:transposase [Streptomyces cacaoi]